MVHSVQHGAPIPAADPTGPAYAVITLGLDGRIVALDEAAIGLLGPGAPSLVGRDAGHAWRDLSGTADAFAADRDAALRTGAVSGKRRLRRPDGRMIGAHAALRVVRDGAADPTGFVALLRPDGLIADIAIAADIGDHQADIERARAAVAFATSGGDVGWWEHTPTDGRWFWDARMRELVGVGADAPAGPATLLPLMRAEDRAVLRDAVAAAIRPDGRGKLNVEYAIPDPADGSLRWLWCQGRAVHEDGACVRLVGFVQEVTERKRTETALHDSEARLALALDAAGIGIWDAGPNLRTLHWDDRLRGLFGLRPGSAIDAATNLGAIHPDDRGGVDAALEAAFDASGGGEYDVEFRAIGIDDRVERWLRAKGRVRFDAGAAARFVGAVRDVTVEKRAAAVLAEANEVLEERVAARTAELARTAEALVQSQKMEAVGQLTGGLAHDFNNLLTAIMGSLEMIGNCVRQGRHADLERYVAASQSAAKRAASLTHRLLAFSRRQTLDPRPTDINALIVGLDELIRRTVGPAIAVETVAAAGLWTAMVDPSQLENALLNLSINARDALPNGGRLTIETANRWLDERAARERDIPAGQYVTLSVSDNGIGMTPEVASRAFDPFFTTKPIGKGTGLGLSMVYGFVRQSGGLARIYSEPGTGTAVRIYLPRVDVPIAEERAFDGLPEATPRHAGRTVLVVDDEPTLRMLIAEVLEQLGFRAIEMSDGPSALRILQSGMRVDLLITDVGLPGGLNGRQVADAARVGRPGLHVLFVTGYAENAVLGGGLLEPGMQVLTKPFGMDELARRIASVLGGTN